MSLLQNKDKRKTCTDKRKTYRAAYQQKYAYFSKLLGYVIMLAKLKVPAKVA
jgi:hypothetical protein